MRKSHDDIHCGYDIRNELNALWPRSIICIEYCRNFIFWSGYTKPMKYFWWRFLDYVVGVFVGGLMVFLVNRFLCHDCVGNWTPILMLAIWIALMLFCNYLFQAFRPRQI